MSEYFTVTMDHSAQGTGHTRAILIQRAQDEEDAREHFGKVHGNYFASDATVVKGIRIEPEFQDLVTETARKFILKLTSKNPDAPGMFSYSNSIYLDY
jgi:hypothetical protein